MKKNIKRLSALVLAVACCIVLCSCSAIKEMRASQAFEGENEGEIIWGGQVYRELDIRSELPEGIELKTNEWGRVTEKDVPVLLSEFFGADMYCNHNKTVIETGIVKPFFYAREDVYDYVENLIKYPALDEYCVEYEVGPNYEKEYELLKQRYLNAIDEIIYGGNEVYTDYEDYEEIAIEDYTDIYKCDEKMVFQSLAYRVEERKNGDMFLTSYITQDIYDYDEIHYGEYRIPDDKKALMKELLTLDYAGVPIH